MPTRCTSRRSSTIPTAWLAYNNLAMLSLAGNPSKEELEKGLAGFRQAMVLAPKEPLVQFNVGTALYRLKRREEALPYLRAAVKGEPRYAEAWGNLGAALQELDRFEESIPPYRRALEVDPSLEWVRYNISAVLLQLGRTDEAAAEIANLPTVGGGIQHRLALAEIFLTQGQFARAIDQYQRAQEAGPLSAEALNHLGYALVQERRAAEAEPYLRRAISLQGNNAAAYSNLGNALQQTGRLEESLAAYRSALGRAGWRLPARDAQRLWRGARARRQVRRSDLPFQGSSAARSDLHRSATEPDEGHALEELICAPAQAPSLMLSFVAPSS